MPRGKGIYDNENTDRVQARKERADQRENDSSESQDTPDVDSSETQEPPTESVYELGPGWPRGLDSADPQ